MALPSCSWHQPHVTDTHQIPWSTTYVWGSCNYKSYCHNLRNGNCISLGVSSPTFPEGYCYLYLGSVFEMITYVYWVMEKVFNFSITVVKTDLNALYGAVVGCKLCSLLNCTLQWLQNPQVTPEWGRASEHWCLPLGLPSGLAVTFVFKFLQG